MALSGDMGHKHQYGPHQGAGKAQATLLSVSTMPSSTMFLHVVNQEENIIFCLCISLNFIKM